MKKSIGGFVVCLLGLVACNVEHYEDCKGDAFDYGDDFGGSHSRAGSTSTAGKGAANAGGGGATAGSGGATAGSGGATAGSGGATSSGGTRSDGDAGAAGAPSPTAPRCDTERDCARGYNCDLDQHECLPTSEETCPELDTEAACTHRSDCTPVYGGTNCSCGQDCECHGGEPGCVCQSFEFFVCRNAG